MHNGGQITCHLSRPAPLGKIDDEHAIGLLQRLNRVFDIGIGFLDRARSSCRIYSCTTRDADEYDYECNQS